MSTVSYLDRFLHPVTEAFTPEFARVLVDLRADAALQAEVEVLREKANEGPRAEECENLLVPVCVSASNVAFAAIRLEPTWMHLGEVSGMAAAQAMPKTL